MAHVMTNEVCLQFNMVGRNGKRPFGSTRMVELVYSKCAITSKKFVLYDDSGSMYTTSPKCEVKITLRPY